MWQINQQNVRKTDVAKYKLKSVAVITLIVSHITFIIVDYTIYMFVTF